VGRNHKEQLLGRLMKRTFFEAPVEHVAPRLLGKLLVHKTRGGVLAGRIVEVEAYLGPHHETADPAAHSHRGPTPRNEVMFGPAGHAYVYAIYGRYYCMNVTCEKTGRAGCILVRALEPVAGMELMARNRGLSAAPPFSQKTRKGWGTFDVPGRRLRISQKTRNGSGGTAHFSLVATDGRDGAFDKTLRDKMLRELTSGPGRLCQAMGLTRAGHNGLDLLDPDSPLQVRDDGMRVSRVLVTRRIGISHAVDLPLRFALPDHPHVSGAKKMAGECIFLRSRSVLKASGPTSKSSERKSLLI